VKGAGIESVVEGTIRLVINCNVAIVCKWPYAQNYCTGKSPSRESFGKFLETGESVVDPPLVNI